MDNALLVSMFNCIADRDKQIQSFLGTQLVLVTIFSDRNTLDQFHHEVWPSRFSRPSIDHPGNIGVIHHRQGLTLSLEAGDDLLGIHAKLDKPLAA